MMNEINTKYLFGRYPKLYRGYSLPMTETCMCWGFETNGDGWFRLIDQLSSDITELDKRDGTETVATQVKEKYGGLRFYIEGGTDVIYALIDKAEADSLTICETCGEPGEQRGTSWISTACNACWEKIQKKEKTWIAKTAIKT